ncbi:DNA polymerase III subunit epsilon [Zooshikella harenae]|uniref:DNA polymerase III subunit epsilon n=1 Tax=Zooshikella harenae TaxID=2827238 RepID=A0ABS5ZF59_9GAMM|nr:DNA polymerase III subunit epsilon [Zooshikella harenae]MBU2711612.1 DNA polymerase III subunit epsilon [Zooshikella harenae]
MRIVVLDTETTGLEPSQGHRIIEIGCVELENRRYTGRSFHCYIQPDREVDEGAVQVHGITSEFLQDKPRFQEIVEEFVSFVKGAELVIHNAPFDVGFINHEFKLLTTPLPGVDTICQITDSLVMARKKHPGQKNSLDALCKRYGVDNSARTYHGALLDAEILADVYLAMTGGQTMLSLSSTDNDDGEGASRIHRVSCDRPPLPIIMASAEEIDAHQAKLQQMADSGACLWHELEGTEGQS